MRLFIDQDALEPILRSRAEELGAELRYRTECRSVSQDADGVTAELLNLDAGSSKRTVRASYLVAADGNRSRIREQLGIAMRGHGLLSNSAMARRFRPWICSGATLCCWRRRVLKRGEAPRWRRPTKRE